MQVQTNNLSQCRVFIAPNELTLKYSLEMWDTTMPIQQGVCAVLVWLARPSLTEAEGVEREGQSRKHCH